MPAALEDLHASLEALALDLLGNLVALISFGLRYALDVEHLFLGAAQSKEGLVFESSEKLSNLSEYLPHEDGEDGGEAGLLELRDVSHIDSVLLKHVNFIERLIL